MCLLMILFLQFLSLLIGLVLVFIFGNKGFFINLALVLIVVFINRLLNLQQILFIIILAICSYLLVIFIDHLVKRKYNSLPIREMIVGGSALSILAGMILRPLLAGTVLGPVLGVPLIRRLTKLGFKAFLLTFGGFLIRTIYSLALNIYVIVKLI